MQHITLEEVKASCRQAYDDGRLLFQDFSGEYGYYIGDQRCAIGSVLNEETLLWIDSHNLQRIVVTNSNREELYSAFTWSIDEEDGLAGIQRLHDQICSWELRIRHLSEPLTKEEATLTFLAAIDYKIAVVIQHSVAA